MALIRTLGQLRAFSTALTPYRTMSELEAMQLIRRENPLRETISQEISEQGYIKMDHFWSIALTDSQHGYYANSNVFSAEGDFTTAPEISPLFGEMVGVWIIYFLGKVGITDKTTNSVLRNFRIVELGGGRGLLIRDVLRAMKDVGIIDRFDLYFVEKSAHNRKEQQDRVLETFKEGDHFFRFEHELATDSYESFLSESEDKSVKLRWFRELESIFLEDAENIKAGIEPPFTIFLMNEFMDALPTIRLRYTS